MKFNYSNEQLLAINSKGQNIIVSAGAGSGKTAVLTERIRQTLQSGVRADQLLVLTFTNAAAAEMKERVIKKMAEDESLKHRTAEVDSAYITTFDSFSLSIVKKYHDRLNLNRNISIIDQSVLNVKKRKTIDDIFLSKYSIEDEDFTRLLTDLSSKSDTEIKKELLNLADKIDAMYNRKQYLNAFKDNFYNEEKYGLYLNEYKEIVFCLVDKLRKNAKKIQEFLTDNQAITYNSNYNLLFSAKTYDEVYNWLQIPFKTLKNLSDEAKEIIEDNKLVIKDLTSLCIYPNESFIKEVFLESKVYANIVIDILQEYFEKLDEYKKSNNIFEFVDIAKIAISLVSENKDIANELKEMFVEILVDEYQDTNDLQELFISYIANNNVYMVGDIKQSIYGFRNANPMIFKEKYDAYRNNNGGMKIDLNQNFRSNRQVLFYINRMFDCMMDDNIGHANFKNEHQMRYGFTKYDEISQENKITFATYEIKKEDNYSIQDVEIFAVLQDIISKVSTKEIIYDSDEKIFRPCEYKDFAILSQDSTSFDNIGALLTHHNIPNLIFKNVEVNKGDILIVLKNLIKLIALNYNKDYKQDYLRCFYGIGRSFVFNYSDEYLFDLITKNEYKDSTLFKAIDEFSKLVDYKSLHDLLEHVLESLNVYEKLISIGEIEENLTRIEYILKLMRSMDILGLDVFEVVEYLDDILKHEEKMEFQSGGLNENKVKIMTIHKSKGLEFPIVYFVGNDKRFNKSEMKEKLLFDNNYGLIVPFFKDGEGRNIQYLLLKQKYNDSLISEKLRLLYVALTRAREQMIVIYKDDNQTYDYEDMVPDVIRRKYNSFSSMFNSVKDKLYDANKQIDIASLNINKDYLLTKKKDIDSLVGKTNIKIEKLVNDIESNEVKKTHASKESKQLIDIRQKESMEYGVYIHELFESCDYLNPSYDLMDEKEKQMINNFINQDVMKNIGKGKIYKEFEFVYKENGQQLHGIIDLMIEYGDHIDIIDYKLSNTEDEAYQTQLLNYKNYISYKTNKKVNLYLYSILKNQIKEIN